MPSILQRLVDPMVALTSGVAGVSYGLIRSLRDPEFRPTLLERLGHGDWRNKSLPSQGEHLWFHAASLGELEGVAPVLRELKARGSGQELLITTTSVSGKRAALEKQFSQHVAHLPADLPNLTKAIVRKHRPSVFVVFETEIWPSLFRQLRLDAVPLIIANGRISDRTIENYKKIRWLLGPTLSAITHVFAQTEVDGDRYELLGVPRDRISINGSTKFDQAPPPDFDKEVEAFRSEIGFPAQFPVFVAGSVRPGEEEAVIKAYERALNYIPELRMIFAPRHPEVADEIAKILTSKNLGYHRRSHGPSAGLKRILILDTLGELKKAYAVAAVAFVGGSLVNIGGHNPLEPAMFGCPVLFGPHSQNVRDITKQLKDAGGLFTVTNAKEMTDLLVRFLSDEVKRSEAGALAREVWRKNLGAAARLVDYLQQTASKRIST